MAAEAALVRPPVPIFDNTSMWHNFTTWTVQHLPFLNVTRLTPSFDDLVWAGPRMVMKLGKLGGAFISLEDFGQRVIPDATDSRLVYATTTTSTGSSVAAAAAAESIASADETAASAASRFSLEGAKGIGSLFSYATSKWALCCIAMAVVLNRTHIFAATRRRLRLRWPVRLVLRALPIVLFLVQVRRLLQSIQCQTSPDFAEMRWGNASRSSDLMFSQPSPLLHGISSRLLLGASDLHSCRAVKMVPADKMNLANDLRGSLSLLWPLFGTFCLSQFLETVSCAVQGRPVSPETGMTLFEHSLAFAEADSAISNQLGWGLFGGTVAMNSSSSTATLGSAIAVTRSMIMKRVNTPPEVLLVAFLSAMSHITSHVLAIFNLQSKFRLISTGFWALCFMGAIIWSMVTYSAEDLARQNFLRFPTVCIIGFIPHVMVMAGIWVCCTIYSLALLLSALAQSENGENLTFKQRLARAHGNMQANVSLGDIRISMEMDFYTALLRAGFGAITMASEAVYLNEDRRVNLKRHTWLEEERYRELEQFRMQWLGSGIPGSPWESIGTIGLVPVKEGQPVSASGYGRERAAQKVSKNKTGERIRPIRAGVGAAERSNRWVLALEYIMHISRLILMALATLLCRFLAAIGFPNPPRWLRWLAQRTKDDENKDKSKGAAAHGVKEASSDWLANKNGRPIPIPRSEHVDVEAEVRRRLQTQSDWLQSGDGERDLDQRLYSFWAKGGYWGNVDASGTYEPSVIDDDLTSVISASEAATSDAGWESDPDITFSDVDDGRRTPTQANPFADYSREQTPAVDNPMAPAELARLLNPRSPEERDQAQALSAHLSNEGVMTRSSYRRFQQRQRAQVLLTSTRGLGDFRPATKLTPDEESQLLEQILLSRRHGGGAGDEATQSADEGGAESSWATGASGLGPDGPQCVVCQSTPRTIIVWPCRCLSLCDDCRVSLAMNNFDKCVCCRREVISFSRIYVP
jgi:hypothetical protein